MAEHEITAPRPFFKPIPEHDSLNTAFLLWRLSEKVELAASGCWVWIGSRNRDGYGQAGAGGSRTELVHRLVYRLCVGSLLPGQEVCHDCPGGDNPACVNPAHLFVGSHTDNMRDCARKGRIKSRDSRGAKNPSAKLSDERVARMRRRHAELSGTSNWCGILADEFGVSGATVRRVVLRVIWRHVP